MASSKRLSSVSHSIAHHAVSGLSYVHPHLRQAAKARAEETVFINLLADEPCPQRFSQIMPLKTALNSLKLRFLEILKSEGFSSMELNAAVLMFEFPENYAADYCSNCHSLLTHKTGKNYLHAVNYMGESISPNNALKALTSFAGTGEAGPLA
jgi:hypothetical protein